MRIASAMLWPCETSTSTCRNFATISSGVYRFFGIAVLLHVKRHYFRSDHFSGGGPRAAVKPNEQNAFAPTQISTPARRRRNAPHNRQTLVMPQFEFRGPIRIDLKRA